ncbi:MAG: hypothetical protein KAJ73_10270 [Zetaproteobacteria bacterium]|nr:hypothetical protein [Zetaproteobacteria bacterium]
MSRLGIHRVVVVVGGGRVQVRAQSRSQRGTMFTVGGAVTQYTKGDKAARFSALEEAINSVLVKKPVPPQ